jgi:ABC-2 type transport system ATP-binding protein
MYEVEMLCENIGIIDLGNLVAFNTPQGLKDNLIKQKEKELLNQKHIFTKVPEEFERTIETSKIETLNDSKESMIDQTTSLDQRGLSENVNVRSYEEITSIHEKSKEISIMINDLDEKMVEDVKKLDIVFNVKVNDNGRLIVDIDKFAEDGVNNIIWSIVKNNGNITSINTKDPSLEDVFVELTRKKTVDESKT